uniref:ATP synthase subunit b n=1 Tax=Fibrocapsa japonica TaxID=94617 RepID=A0A7S2UZE8_9STRA|eukprot:CAMPEP_0113936970 /NCGR_PEP_ID=MMETSP1339-20121228/3694_1 /TAXON_ID=94617 /ORGANISM="Fibrocapsa japonica" /LENGTH=319 /DNA_ID=CAMNT_0000939565 /DNA_START=91 /DNA_END=1050 /DNA_ORIENTATION=+ /assembly_acc=CAM_ASM_000762
MFSRLATPAFQISRAAVKRTAVPRLAVPAFRTFQNAAVLKQGDKEEKAAGADDSGLTLSKMMADWRFSLPIGISLAIPALHQQWIVLSEETMLVACFMFFCSTVYTQGGAAIAASFEEKCQAIIDEQRALEDVSMSATKAQIDTQIARKALLQEFKGIFGHQTQLMEEVVKAQTAQFKHKLRTDVVNKLEAFAQLEDASRQKVQDELINMVTQNVLTTLTTDKELKASVLNEAIQVIADPGKPVDDTVASTFIDAFQSVKELEAAEDGATVDNVKVSKTATAEEFLEGISDDLASAKQRFGIKELELKLPAQIKKGDDF